MILVGFKHDINNPEWYGYFLHIDKYTEMNDIYEAVTYFLNSSGDEKIELRVYNESSRYRDFCPDESNHIGFVTCCVVGSEFIYQVEHFTKDRKLLSYCEWDAVKFYKG